MFVHCHYQQLSLERINFAPNRLQFCYPKFSVTVVVDCIELASFPDHTPGWSGNEYSTSSHNAESACPFDWSVQSGLSLSYQTDRDIYYQAIITKYTQLSHTQFTRVFIDGYSLMCSYLIWKNIAPVYTHMGTGVSS